MYERGRGSSKPSEQIVHLLSAAGAAADALLAERLRERGMSKVHQQVLSALAGFGPHARLDLAVQVAASEADAARVVDELLADGLVQSMVVHVGGRQQLVMLTPAGQAVLDALHGDATATQDVLLVSLTRGERTQLKYLLRRVCASAAAAAHGGRARPTTA